MTQAILFTAILIFVFGLFSRLSDRSPITAPMIFVAVGILVGPLGLDLFKSSLDSELVQTIAEVTLVLILFTDASGIDLRSLDGPHIPAPGFRGLHWMVRTPGHRIRP